MIGNLHSSLSSKAFMSKYINLLKGIGNNIFIICADMPPIYDNTIWFQVKLKPNRNIKMRILNFCLSQLKLMKIILLTSSKFDTSIVLATSFVFPVLFLRICRKKVILYVDGKPNSLFITLLCRFGLIVSNLLIVESDNVKSVWKIDKYISKIVICPLYVDTDIFNEKIKVNDRVNFVGYIGNLDENKGLVELMEAISILNDQGRKISFIIGGKGNLDNLIIDYSNKYSNIEFKGLIDNKCELPDILNKLKLLVLPSYSEGLPNIVLEAMSCGTPVLATPVGGIPDVIKDEKTGFILEENSPRSIAVNIIKALNHPNLENITENAKRLINENFTYEQAVRRYNEIL